MSCEVDLATSIKVLILCVLTCLAYLVTFSINMMCTRVSCCDYCVAISRFIPCFNTVYVFCSGSSSEPTESIS